MRAYHISAVVLASLLGSTAFAAPITIVNSDFGTIYKPGSTTITGTLSVGAYTNGFPSSSTNVQVNGGSATFSDNTTGNSIDIPGWVSVGTNPFPSIYATGVQNQSLSEISALPGGGNAHGWVGEINLALANTLSAVLLADSTYTLSFYVGDRFDRVAPNGLLYGALFAGANQLTASPTPITNYPADGQWSLYSYTFVTDSNPVGLGQPLQIRLGTGVFSSNAQPQFDNVTLDVTTLVVPEPTSMAVLGLASMLMGRRRR